MNNEPFPSSFAVNNARVAYPRMVHCETQVPWRINNNIISNVMPVMTEANAHLQYYRSVAFFQQQQHHHHHQQQQKQ